MRRWILRISLFICVLVFTASVFDSNTNYALAKDDDLYSNYTYTEKDCTNYGLDYDPRGGGSWGTGCVFYKAGSDGPNSFTKDPIGSNDDLLKHYGEAYTNSKQNLTKCFQGYKLEDKYKFNKDSAPVKACVKKKKNSKLDGTPSDIKSLYTPEKCKKDGGEFTLSYADGKNTGRCSFRQGPKDSDFYSTASKDRNPKLYYVDASEKCSSGYKESGTEIINGKNMKKCTLKKQKKDSEGNPVNPETGEVSDDSDSDGDTNSCDIQWVGWVVCPVTRTSYAVVVWVYDLIQKNFLQIKSSDLFADTDSSPTKKYWESFRDMANIVFVIAIAMVILSQVTGFGISNYGIKKMLPKIIIYAILVNISWYVTVIFVDISNIVGASLYDILVEESWKLSKEGSDIVEGVLSGTTLGDNAETVIGLVGVALVSAASILSFLAAAVCALILMIAILSIREAAVIVLVVISPIAFACAILPNTETFFNKWFKLLKSLLIIYPICSLTVGGSILVSNILFEAAKGNPIMQMIYGVIPVLSFFLIIAIIKGVLALVDSITGGNFGQKLQNAHDKIKDKAQNNRFMDKVKSWDNNKNIIPTIRNGKPRFTSRGNIARNLKASKEEAARKQDHAADMNYINTYESSVANGTATPGQIREYRNALNRINVRKNEDISSGAVAFAAQHGTDANAAIAAFQTAVDSKDEVRARAALEGMKQMGLSQGQINGAIENVASSGALASMAKDNAVAASGLISHINRSAGGDIKKSSPALSKYLQQDLSSGNHKDLNDLQNDVNTYSGLSNSALMGMSDADAGHMAKAVETAMNSGNAQQIYAAQGLAAKAQSALELDKQKGELNSIQRSELERTASFLPKNNSLPSLPNSGLKQEELNGMVSSGMISKEKALETKFNDTVAKNSELLQQMGYSTSSQEHIDMVNKAFNDYKEELTSPPPKPEIKVELAPLPNSGLKQAELKKMVSSGTISQAEAYEIKFNDTIAKNSEALKSLGYSETSQRHADMVNKVYEDYAKKNKK